MARPGMLTLEQLRSSVEDGSIDTVLVAFTDMQGRLQGKRCAAPYFLDEVVPHAAEACTYLLAVDVEMNTVGGYAMSSWERGYGDFVLKPDLATLRLLPRAGGAPPLVWGAHGGAGMVVESAKGECNLGQHEIAFRYADALTTCDNHTIYKTGAKEIADQAGT